MTMPQRRRELLARSVAGETVVYDEVTQRAHALPASVAPVFALCDGVSSFPQVAVTTGLPIAEIERAVAALDASGLLVTTSNRRAFLTKAGLVGGSALALPVIGSIAAPIAAMAATNPPFSVNFANVTQGVPQAGYGGYNYPAGSTFTFTGAGSTGYVAAPVQINPPSGAIQAAYANGGASTAPTSQILDLESGTVAISIPAGKTGQNVIVTYQGDGQGVTGFTIGSSTSSSGAPLSTPSSYSTGVPSSVQPSQQQTTVTAIFAAPLTSSNYIVLTGTMAAGQYGNGTLIYSVTLY